MKRQMFFKTVRSDGRSLFAHGSLSRIYEVGKRYKFPKKLPAHVFTLKELGLNDFDSDRVYNYRLESGRGNRVLICYGFVKEEQVPCFDVFGSWNFDAPYIPTARRSTSYDFMVIGEVALSKSHGGKRPDESTTTFHTMPVVEVETFTKD